MYSAVLEASRRLATSRADAAVYWRSSRDSISTQPPGRRPFSGSRAKLAGALWTIQRWGAESRRTESDIARKANENCSGPAGARRSLAICPSPAKRWRRPPTIRVRILNYHAIDIMKSGNRFVPVKWREVKIRHLGRCRLSHPIREPGRRFKVEPFSRRRLQFGEAERIDFGELGLQYRIRLASRHQSDAVVRVQHRHEQIGTGSAQAGHRLVHVAGPLALEAGHGSRRLERMRRLGRRCRQAVVHDDQPARVQEAQAVIHIA